jgi:hypothetical protein
MTVLEWARSMVPQYQVSDDELRYLLWNETAWPLCTDSAVIRPQLEKALDSLRLR